MFIVCLKKRITHRRHPEKIYGYRDIVVQKVSPNIQNIYIRPTSPFVDIYIYIYIRLKIKPNSVRIRF